MTEDTANVIETDVAINQQLYKVTQDKPAKSVRVIADDGEHNERKTKQGNFDS